MSTTRLLHVTLGPLCSVLNTPASECLSPGAETPAKDPHPLMRFCAPPATSPFEFGQTQVYLTWQLPSLTFLKSSTVYTSSGLPALFHAGAAHGVQRARELLLDEPLLAVSREQRYCVPGRNQASQPKSGTNHLPASSSLNVHCASACPAIHHLPPWWRTGRGPNRHAVPVMPKRERARHRFGLANAHQNALSKLRTRSRVVPTSQCS